ncbi:putative transcription factor C2H2 family [Helianthus annuus]|uniref:RBR-type E3 ubiquitin transferase n=1 Tax=Helianthus annuus TaxID=4232 RepID=A0A9K3HCC8_HELAN|nr:putative transcription factor C2H2 family [Helianthus annuus]KAJ0476768.1 putative transcription factor C2H2 family [Helianthus annuus]KAJ0497594.1 putative transcription factor C2H2 family [Helianthus annuus]KAJ0671099.1 putative transcription factor C2H2 family [Helianthus annuus]KAJ0849081.1 putative transcription factor C2H2 family [Helianthus annuus]
MQLTGKERPTNNMTLTFVDALIFIQRKVGYRGPFLMQQSSVKVAYKLAKTAMASQATKFAEKVLEQCAICLEYKSKGSMFSHNNRSHKYCYSCMNKHVESKLLQGQLPECPHKSCKFKLEIESCKKFLNKRLHDIMSSRIKEASIPPTERVYCPFPKCSFLMSKTDLQNAASTSSHETWKRKCSKCRGRFCMNCKVPWHDKTKCSDYIKNFANQFVNEVELKSLAARNRWRQCIKCMQMIELAAGCHHISCRCGYEFCYRCGGAWINKTATCSCPLWDLGYILYAE